MSGILLDTSAYVAFLEGQPGICEEIRQASMIGLTPVFLAELYIGFVRDTKRDEDIKDFHAFLESPRVNIFDMTSETAKRYAKIHDDLRSRGRPIPTNDVWLAASAMEHGLELVTCDKHFEHVSQIIVRYHNP